MSTFGIQAMLICLLRSCTMAVVIWIVLMGNSQALAATLIETHEFTPPAPALDDNFGRSLAVQGNTLIIGENQDTSNNGAGSAHVYDIASKNKLFTLTASDPGAFDSFGISVGMSGNTAIVGAHRDDQQGPFAGAAYLFDVTTGTQLHKLTANDAGNGDSFGQSVDVSVNIAIVGSPKNNHAATDAGSAYLFDVTTGQQLHKLTASDAALDVLFGHSVAISGNTAIVGALGDNSFGSASGAAYLFDVTTGAQLFKLTASDASSGKRFGRSVDIDGDIAIIGTGFDDSAYLFDITSGSQLHKLTALDSPIFLGQSVALSGNSAVVGAPNSNSAYLFDTLTGNQLQKLTASNGTPVDDFGWSVATNGNDVIVGAPSTNGSLTGSAHLFQVPEPTCALMGLVNLLALLAVRRTRRISPINPYR